MGRSILCVLAGGRSRRFGGSKLAVRVDGRPLLTWVADRLAGWSRGAPGAGGAGGASGSEQRWLSVAAGGAGAGGWPTGMGCYQRWIADRCAYPGPLAAIAGVLDEVEDDDVVAFVPADMPVLSRFDLARLTARLRGHVGVMARWGTGCAGGAGGKGGAGCTGGTGPRGGDVEPMPCVLRGARSLVQQCCATGVSSVYALASRPEIACVELEHPRDCAAYLNLNRRDDLPGIEAALGVAVEV